LYSKSVYFIAIILMAILGTFAPIIVHSLINDSSQNSTLISATTTPPTAVDKFGIKKIYPTKQSGREWFINMDNPTSDGIFHPQSTITRQPDGSWQIGGAGHHTNGKNEDSKVRMNVNTPEGMQPWKNVEITGYAKVISANSPTDDHLDWYARGGRHSDDVPCDGTALKGWLGVDGTASWIKEIWFTDGYTDQLAKAKVTNDSILGRWIGWKVIIYNMDNDSAVRMQSYIDDKNNNHWVKVTDIIDDGGWYANASDNVFYSADCGKPKDYIITNSGPTVAFRSDNIVWDLKNLSVREIEAPPLSK
jgi:hypothetical protein